MPRRSRAFALLLVLAGPLLHIAHGALVLEPADVPGFEVVQPVERPTSRVLREIAAGGLLRALRRAEGRTAAYRAGAVSLRSTGFLLKNEQAASRTLRGIVRLQRKRGGTVESGSAGDESWIVRQSETKRLLAWRTGRGLGVLALDGAVEPAVVLERYGELATALLGAEARRSEWQRVIERTGADGEPTLQQALDAFAVTYRRIPGSRLRPLREGVFEGTMAGRWILSYWDQLTPKQKKIVLTALGLAEPSASGGRAERLAARAVNYGDPDFVPNPTLQADLERAANVIAARIGRPFPFALVAGTSKDLDDPEAQADAFTMDADGAFAQGANIALCRIRALPKLLTSYDATYRYQVMVHEAFHCMQGAIMGEAYLERPRRDWMLEGSAEWVALSVVRQPFLSPAAAWLQWYVLSPVEPLFARKYAAVGFFGHADDVAGELWKLLPGILTAPDDFGSFTGSGGMRDDFLHSWASSVWRLDPPLGPNWTMASPVPAEANTKLKTPSRPVWSPGGLFTVAPFTTAHYVIDGADGLTGSAGRALLYVAIDGHARLSDLSIDTTDLDDDWFCIVPPCQCPTERQGRVPPTRPLNLPATLAVTGDPDADGTPGFLRFVPLEEFCDTDRRPPRFSGPPGPQPGGGGGSSNGDPHIWTFDDVRYDFQAVGEFTLVRATGDDLEIQVRQEPYPGSRWVSINTAVGMRVAGDRVLVEAGTPLRLRVGSEPLRVPIGTSKNLPGGGRITAHQDQVAIGWPDGSEARIWSVGAYGVAALFAPAPSRRGALRGLLGDGDGTGANDFVTRDGALLDRDAVLAWTSAGYDLLYRRFGESWRIAQADSLLDYPAGKTTESFTDRSFPDRFLLVSDLSDLARSIGEQVCRDAGISDPGIFAACVLDVGLTNDPAFATDGAILELTRTAAPPQPDWTPVPGLERRSGPLTLAVDASDTLHVVAPLESADGTDSIAHLAIASNGTVGRPAVLDSYLTGEPHLVPRPDGGLHVTMPSIRTPPPPGVPESGTFTWDAPAGGTPWARGPFVKTAGYSYVGFAPACYGPGGALFTALPGVGDARVFRGSGLGGGDPGTPLSTGGSCTAQAPIVACDTTGVWAAWVQDFCSNVGYWTAPLDPATGALAGAAQRAPESTHVSGAIGETFISPTRAVALVSPSGGAGPWMAYPQRTGAATYRVLLWQVGAGAPLEAGTTTSEPADVTLSTEPASGRIWVAWTANRTLTARRLTADRSGLEPAVYTLEAPPEATGVLDWAIGAANGRLEVLAGMTAAFATDGRTWRIAVRP